MIRHPARGPGYSLSRSTRQFGSFDYLHLCDAGSKGNELSITDGLLYAVCIDVCTKMFSESLLKLTIPRMHASFVLCGLWPGHVPDSCRYDLLT